MKYLLLLAKTLIYRYVQNKAYLRLITYMNNSYKKNICPQNLFNQNFFFKIFNYKVYNGIINFEFHNSKKSIIKHT